MDSYVKHAVSHLMCIMVNKTLPFFSPDLVSGLKHPKNDYHLNKTRVGGGGGGLVVRWLRSGLVVSVVSFRRPSLLSPRALPKVSDLMLHPLYVALNSIGPQLYHPKNFHKHFI